MRTISRLCSRQDRDRAVDAWAAAAAAHTAPDEVWRAACARAGRPAAALVRGAVALGEVPVTRAALFADAALAAASEAPAPCRILGTVLEAAAALARTAAAGVGPAPRARTLLRAALRTLPLDLADPRECAALAEAHALYAAAFLRPAGTAGLVRRRHLQLAAACGVEDATALLLQDAAAAPGGQQGGTRAGGSASPATPVALPDGVEDAALLAAHPLTLALARAAAATAGAAGSAGDPVRLLCAARRVSRLFYHCASLVLEQRGLFVAPACPLARPRHAACAPPDPASPLAAVVGTRAWARLVVALDRDALAALRATARWVRDAVDALPRVRLALAHWQAAAAFSAQSPDVQQQGQGAAGGPVALVRRAAHAGGVAASSLVALVTGHDVGDGKDSPSAAARCSYYAGSAVSLLVLSPLLAACDACALLVGAAPYTEQQGQAPRAWESVSARCALCNAVFGRVRCRRHHCRCCGRAVCARCSRLLVLPPSPLRAFLRRAVPAPGAPGAPERFCTACAPALELGHLPPDHPMLAVW